ncbi:unnamed protein product [Acanthoscelides obtectus]|uniref:Uncharacterized protein n=1 Tax=Acanthoscelides obtectus TaxID=200917 RepID=A0A9P0L8J2_ACAOB|nr:unnamed protein product [Acanthoscelides obtectus]CAK1668731.1 hypothetical protein AOBTE_LOCUS26567 [Acanthoscelides obtectus]
MENIQKRATRIPHGIQRPCYDERLNLFSLTHFSDRRLRRDLVVTGRALHGFFSTDMSSLFRCNANHLQGRNCKLMKVKF